MKISVIICTKDRSESLKRLINCLTAQTCKPDEVIVVDDGDMGNNGLSKALESCSIPYKYIKKDSPGTTKSRNIGVKNSCGDIVLFLDDDVTLEKGYVESILDHFQNDKSGTIGGVGGVVIPEKKTNFFIRLFLFTFFLDSARQGVVLPSGWGVIVREIKNPINVDWLSGCNMSFRRRVFGKFWFDENFVDNGWGDDRDFSYRVGKTFKLLVTPRAKGVHHQNPLGRLIDKEFEALEIRHLALFFEKNMPKTRKNKLCFQWALKGIRLKNFCRRNMKKTKVNA